jgi:hypothetical protein
MTLLSNTTQEKAMCPTCDFVIQTDDLLSPAALRSTVKVPLPVHLCAASSEDEIEGNPASSSKIEELLQVSHLPCDVPCMRRCQRFGSAVLKE